MSINITPNRGNLFGHQKEAGKCKLAPLRAFKEMMAKMETNL